MHPIWVHIHAMLHDHLKSTGEGVHAFADRLGVSRNTIQKIVYGSRRPSPELAIKISEATQGKVQPLDLLTAKPSRRAV